MVQELGNDTKVLGGREVGLGDGRQVLEDDMGQGVDGEGQEDDKAQVRGNLAVAHGILVSLVEDRVWHIQDHYGRWRHRNDRMFLYIH